MLRRIQNWIAHRHLVKQKRDLDRAVALLREFITLDVAIDPETVEALVERARPKVLEILARTDPVFLQRALTFSQEGEDLILLRLFADRPPGFFVDVGAHHPFRFSNTFLLYNAGWRGINIDATPGSMQAFQQFRPDDINIECFVGDPATEKTFTIYNEPALNTGSKEIVGARPLPSDKYWPVSTATMQPRGLSGILDQYVPNGTSIALLNIDVEGGEQEVLESNDWSRYRPEIILIEQLSTGIDESLRHPTTKFLNERNYRLVAKAFNSSFFELVEKR
jgi:hypothetical protein